LLNRQCSLHIPELADPLKDVPVFIYVIKAHKQADIFGRVSFFEALLLLRADKDQKCDRKIILMVQNPHSFSIINLTYQVKACTLLLWFKNQFFLAIFVLRKEFTKCLQR